MWEKEIVHERKREKHDMDKEHARDSMEKKDIEEQYNARKEK